MRSLGSRLLSKLRQSAAFLAGSRTPVPLILDSFKLQRRPFVAASSQGLKLELLPRGGESFTFYENLIRQDYLQHGVQLREGDTVIDVGANIGSFTVLAARRVGEKGRVFAFEPARVAFNRLQRNVQVNALKNVTCIRAGLAGVNGEARLFLGDRSAYATLYENIDGRTSARPELVEIRTLASVMEGMGMGRIKLLKLDCEGAEYDILESLDLETARNIEQIALEVHRIPGRTVSEIPRILDKLGFVTRQGYPLMAFRPPRV